MASPEKRTKQIALGKWDEARRKGGKEGLKRKPTRLNLIGQAEAKKESVESFKRLLGVKPGRNVEIKAYWSGRRGKFYEKTLKHDSKKMVKGKEVVIEVPCTIKQIAILSAKNGIPESISVKTVDRWYVEGFLPRELIIDTSVETAETRKQVIPVKESSIISSYSLADRDYGSVFLSVARELDPGYANMSFQDIVRDLSE